tara:strand:- start:791 stop:1213 length:423 start_codon:yes stop_codon:yes gene_type:complete
MNNKISNKSEYKIFGLTIEYFSVFYGSFLIFWGVIISFMSGSDSLTSFIPSLIGLPILIFSNLSIRFENNKKLFMHIVALFGLIVFLGGLDFLRSLLSGSTFQNVWADISKIMMLITGAFFLYQCIKSFIHIRKNKNFSN